MTARRKWIAAAIMAVAFVALGVGSELIEQRASAAQVMAPMFEVDPFWPKPLPNHWLLGSAVCLFGWTRRKVA